MPGFGGAWLFFALNLVAGREGQGDV